MSEWKQFFCLRREQQGGEYDMTLLLYWWISVVYEFIKTTGKHGGMCEFTLTEEQGKLRIEVGV